MPLSTSPYQYNFRPPDHNLLAWNYDGPSSTAGASVPLATGGTLYVQKLKVPVASSVTNVVYYLTTLGTLLTSGQCFIALYQRAAGALIGVSADQSAVWATPGTTGLKTTALVGGPFVVQAGDIYVAFWYNGTTGPAFHRTSGLSGLMNAGLGATVSRWGTADTGTTTTAPTTLGTIAASSTAYWMGLS